MTFAGLVTTSSSALVTILFVVWGVVWGVLSLSIIAIWLRPRLIWLTLGLLGPLGPIVAVAAGLLLLDRSSDV